MQRDFGDNISKKIANITLAASVLAFLSLFIWTQPIIKLSLLFIWSIFSIILTFSLPQKSLLIRSVSYTHLRAHET